MAIDTQALADLPDETLTDTVTRLARLERHAAAQLVAALAEFDARRLYLGAGCASLFAYCTRVLFFSEHAAYHRIGAARAARRFPIVLDALADGSMTLTTVTLLAPHLTSDNLHAVLAAARHKSKREVERQIAALAPKPDVPSSVRRHPVPARPPVSSPALAGASPLLDPPTACMEPCLSPPAPAVTGDSGSRWPCASRSCDACAACLHPARAAARRRAALSRSLQGADHRERRHG